MAGKRRLSKAESAQARATDRVFSWHLLARACKAPRLYRPRAILSWGRCEKRGVSRTTGASHVPALRRNGTDLPVGNRPQPTRGASARGRSSPRGRCSGHGILTLTSTSTPARSGSSCCRRSGTGRCNTRGASTRASWRRGASQGRHRAGRRWSMATRTETVFLGTFIHIYLLLG